MPWAFTLFGADTEEEEEVTAAAPLRLSPTPSYSTSGTRHASSFLGRGGAGRWITTASSWEIRDSTAKVVCLLCIRQGTWLPVIIGPSARARWVRFWRAAMGGMVW